MTEKLTNTRAIAIWAFRDDVRTHEKLRPTLANPQPSYAEMHELARHVMHSSEVSATALNVIDSMLAALSTYDGFSTASSADPAPEIRRQKSLLQCMHLRSKALEERLRNEINLAFHISSQADSLIAAKIAHAAQVDSSAMKTISSILLPLYVLPFLHSATDFLSSIGHDLFARHIHQCQYLSSNLAKSFEPDVDFLNRHYSRCPSSISRLHLGTNHKHGGCRIVSGSTSLLRCRSLL